MTIDEYINLQNEDVREILLEVKKTIKEALKDANEKIAWGMPTFYKRYNIIHFAANKNHLGIYPGPLPIEHFKEKLKNYKTSKGAIQFPFNKEIPLDLIKEIAIYSDNLLNNG